MIIDVYEDARGTWRETRREVPPPPDLGASADCPDMEAEISGAHLIVRPLGSNAWVEVRGVATGFGGTVLSTVVIRDGDVEVARYSDRAFPVGRTEDLDECSGEFVVRHVVARTRLPATLAVTVELRALADPARTATLSLLGVAP